MPKRRSAVKSIRQAKKRRQRNLMIKNRLKKTIKKFHKLILEKNIQEAKEVLKNIYSQLDKAAKKKIIHPNTASRKKSRLSLCLLKAT